jgi:hypothetical protein
MTMVAPVARNVALYPLDVTAEPSSSRERSKIVKTSLSAKLLRVGSTL